MCIIYTYVHIYITCTNTYRYETWLGNNYFFMKGKIMLGDDLAMFIFANITIYTPSIVFAVAVLPRIVYGVYWGILLLILFTLSMLNYYFTAFTEPGIVPRNSVYKRVEAAGNMEIGVFIVYI